MRCAKPFLLALLVSLSGLAWAQEAPTSFSALDQVQSAQLWKLLKEGQTITAALQKNYDLRLKDLDKRESALTQRESDYQTRELTLTEREAAQKRMAETLADSEKSLAKASKSLKTVNLELWIWRGVAAASVVSLVVVAVTK
jgi:hypothetical protein